MNNNISKSLFHFDFLKLFSRNLSLGQPSATSHPHLLRQSEITPGITLEEYKTRRNNFIQTLPDNSITIIPGYGLRYSTSNIFYPFHQNTNLLYLSGFNEPDSALVFEKSSDSDSKTTFYVRPKHKEYEMWDGARTGLSGALNYFGAEKAESIEDLPDFLNSLQNSSKTIITDLNLSMKSQELGPLDLTGINTNQAHSTHHPSELINLPTNLQGFYNKSKNFFSWSSNNKRILKASDYTYKMRLYKSEAETSVMRHSGRISGKAIANAMSLTRPGMTEHQIHAILNYQVMMRGSTGLSYVPVVAGGKNALTLHYVRNDQVLNDGDLVLVDAGGEYGNYASDITRTWPVNGKFTKAQRDVYEIVLRVQKKIIERCDERYNNSLDTLQNLTFELLRAECSKLFDRSISDNEMNLLYPHHVSHWIGLDLHDTPSVPRTITLKAGMVVTVEPGLYIPDSEMYPIEYRGIGIRIEDDISVGNQATGGPIILSVEAPKEIEDIEAIMSGVINPPPF